MGIRNDQPSTSSDPNHGRCKLYAAKGPPSVYIQITNATVDMRTGTGCAGHPSTGSRVPQMRTITTHARQNTDQPTSTSGLSFGTKPLPTRYSPTTSAGII